jgi:hypothetical protein
MLYHGELKMGSEHESIYESNGAQCKAFLFTRTTNGAELPVFRFNFNMEIPYHVFGYRE